MNLLTWNIRHGGNPAGFSTIAETVQRTAADVVVITEYRTGRSQALIDLLISIGLSHVVTTSPPIGVNGVALLSREPILTCAGPTDILPYRWIEARVPAYGMSVVGLHIPVAGEGDARERKRLFWQRVVEFAESRCEDRVILVGDFNTGLSVDAEGTSFVFGEFMEKLLMLGWVDAWRAIHGPNAREYTWYSNSKHGFRLDYAFVSPPIADAVRTADHLHDVRRHGVSDHAALLVQIDIS